MNTSWRGIDLMNLLAKSAAKINAMEDRDVKKKELESKLPSTAMCQDVASIIYHYLRQISPKIASLLLNINPEIDMDFNISLEEVVQEWQIKARKGAIQSLDQDVTSIAYHYIQGVSPTIASSLLYIHPGINMDCNFTLEEVVEEWKV